MLEVIIFSLLGGVISLIGGVLLLKSDKSAKNLSIYATPFAAGVLLAVAFGDLLPEAIHQSETGADSVLTFALIGILLFFVLEKSLRWFHHHHDEEGALKASSSLIIIGDTLHNALDGIAIGAAFLIDPSTGIVTTFAVAMHEIPQEIGDFGLLLRNGMERSKVLLVNILSALATTLMAVIVYALGDSFDIPIPFLLAITAGFFIYIATSDIIPEIHNKIPGKKHDIRPLILVFGAVLMLVISPVAHKYIDQDHSHDHEEIHNEGNDQDADHSE